MTVEAMSQEGEEEARLKDAISKGFTDQSPNAHTWRGCNNCMHFFSGRPRAWAPVTAKVVDAQRSRFFTATRVGWLLIADGRVSSLSPELSGEEATFSISRGRVGPSNAGQYFAWGTGRASARTEKKFV